MTKTIESDTSLLPWVIADSVVREAECLIERELSGASDWLAARADTTYSSNARFRKLIRSKGDAPRDWLYAFMRHWVSAWVKEHVGNDAFARLPSDFRVGAEARHA